MKQLKVKPERRSAIHTKVFHLSSNALADILMLPKGVEIMGVHQQLPNGIIEATLVSTKEIPDGECKYYPNKKKRGGVGLFKWVWEKK